MEDTIKTESAERKERHDRLIEALREKQRAVLDSRDDEITELKIKLSDAVEQQERHTVERDSL